MCQAFSVTRVIHYDIVFDPNTKLSIRQINARLDREGHIFFDRDGFLWCQCWIFVTRKTDAVPEIMTEIVGQLVLFKCLPRGLVKLSPGFSKRAGFDRVFLR